MLCHLESSDRCRLAALCQRGVTINMPRDAASHPGFLFIFFFLAVQRLISRQVMAVLRHGVTTMRNK